MKCFLLLKKVIFLENPAAIENLQEFTNYNITHKSF